jgi:curved DNA-binding protein
VLRDKDKRAQYDQLRARGYRPGEDFRRRRTSATWRRRRQSFRRRGGFRFEQGVGGDGFSDFFESLFGGGRARGAAPAPARAAGRHARQAGDSAGVAYSGGMQKIGVDGRTLEVKIPVGIRPAR